MPSVFSEDKSILQTYFEIAADKYPGVYLTWEPLTQDDYGLNVTPTSGEQVVQRIYVIKKAPAINGNFIEINRQNVPDNEYLDQYGKPDYYYKITLVEYNLSSETETVIAESGPISGDAQLIRASLAYEVKQFLDIPVYDDELVFNSDRTQAKLGHGLVVYNPAPQLRISAKSNDGLEEAYKIIDFTNGLSATNLLINDSSQNYIINDGQSSTRPIETLFYILKQNGHVFFQGLYQNRRYPVAIPYYDTIFASYRVRLFSNSEMNDALYQALQYINAFPGSNKYRSVEATPFYYEQALITIATFFLLRRLILRLSQREIRLLLGDLNDTPGQGYTGGIDAIKDMLNMYKEQADDMRKNAAWAVYPTIRTYTTETYQLPGSRSYLFRSMFFKAGAYG